MATGKYQEWLSEEGLLKLSGWARDGLTDEQIASNMGIVRSTLSEWKKKYKDISDTLKSNKDVADRQVENELFNKATGFTRVITKPIKIKNIEYDNGKKILETETIKYVEEEVYFPPDTTAQIFWLKNRKPKEWRDRQEIDTTITINKGLEDFFGDD